jgi:hypothetical protein
MDGCVPLDKIKDSVKGKPLPCGLQDRFHLPEKERGLRTKTLESSRSNHRIAYRWNAVPQTIDTTELSAMIVLCEHLVATLLADRRIFEFRVC